RVFPGRYPDVFSGIAVAAVTESFYSVETPLSVNGVSASSTGVAALFLPPGSGISADFDRLNAAAALGPRAQIPHLPVFPFAPVAESFLVAQETLAAGDALPAVDRRQLARLCAEHFWARDEAAWRDGLGRIRQALADDAALQLWFDAEWAPRPFQARPAPRLRGPHLGFREGALHLDTRPFGVTDIFGAAQLCAQLLFVGDALEVDETTSDDAEVDALRRVSQERLEVIQRLDAEVKMLHQVAAERLDLINQLNGHAATLGAV